MAQEKRLREWAEAAGCVIADADWLAHRLVSAATAEHEVRYRAADHRAVKKTWPGTFGFLPKRIGPRWTPQPATALEYLERHRLQNDIFDDDIRVEGVMLSDAPSMLIGQPAGGVSFVISQRWLESADPARPHPGELEIAAYLKERGFTPLFSALFGWQREQDGVVILDAKPDNFIATPDGLLPIDLLLTASGD